MSNERAKKNRTYIENLIISENVDKYLREGYPLEQAQAISFRKFRDGELTIPNVTREQSKAIKQSKTNQIRGLLLLFRLGQMAYNNMTKEDK